MRTPEYVVRAYQSFMSMLSTVLPQAATSNGADDATTPQITAAVAVTSTSRYYKTELRLIAGAQTPQASAEGPDALQRQQQPSEEQRRLSTLQLRLEEASRNLEKATKDHDTAFASYANEVKGQLSQAGLYLRRSEARVAELEHRLSHVQDEQHRTALLLDIKSTELREAQVYLTKIDDVADCDILRLIGNINSVIFQTSATIADSFQGRFRSRKDTEIAQQAGKRLEDLLGQRLPSALVSVDHVTDSFLVQTALQAAMTAYTRWLCSTLCFGTDDTEYRLQSMYSSIRAFEPQSVSGRWRALSRTHIKALLPDDQARKQIASEILTRKICDVLLASSVSVSQEDLREEIRHNFARGLCEVVHLSFEFQRITGEKIISRDLLAVTSAVAEAFDSARMDDEWADTTKANLQTVSYPVLCTTQLGLVREEIKERRDGVVSEGERISSVILLKPRVVLDNTLEEFLNEHGAQVRERTCSQGLDVEIVAQEHVMLIDKEH